MPAAASRAGGVKILLIFLRKFLSYAEKNGNFFKPSFCHRQFVGMLCVCGRTNFLEAAPGEIIFNVPFRAPVILLLYFFLLFCIYLAKGY